MDTDAANRPETPPPTSARDSTCNQRLQIQTLRDAGFTYEQIRGQISDVTLHQIAYAVNHRITPKKGSGRPPMLTSEKTAQIIEWIYASKHN
jgi:hypothetical protein